MMTKHRMINVLALGIAGLSIVGCEHTPERLVSVPEPMASSAAESWRADSSGVALLAKGLALAMASPEIRQQLLDDKTTPLLSAGQLFAAEEADWKSTRLYS